MLTDGLFYDYYHYLKKHFGTATYKVSLDAGFTCPNIDGTVSTGGCTYCNNRSFIPGYIDRNNSINCQLEQGIASQRKRYGAECFLAYFQAYTNTHDSVDRLEECYRTALRHPGIDGLVVGTRADCLSEPVVALLESLARFCYVAVEIGIESVDDRTLRRINRGHGYAAVVDACDRIAGRGIAIGAHLILGFPWESRHQWVDSAEVVSALPIDYLKIHHLQMIKGTALANRYLNTPFPLPGFRDWVVLVTDFLERLRPGIAIARMSGSAPPDMLIAPKWGKKKHSEVKQHVVKELELRKAFQGKRYGRPTQSAHP